MATDDSLPVIILSVLATLALAALAIAKGKVVLGVVAMLFPLVGLIAAIRLAKPDSPWARRRTRRTARRWPRPSGASRSTPPVTSASRTAWPVRRGGRIPEVELTPGVQLTVTVEGT